ncbi:MAG: hypothetical protein KKE16_00365 [Firmicutes bacterium]|nr:hypothetical protein [Bacillota bacterium]
MIRITELSLPLDNAIDKETEIASLRHLIISKLHIQNSDILSLTLQRKALDARKKQQIHFVYNVDLTLKNESMLTLSAFKNVKEISPVKEDTLIIGNEELTNRPVVIGFGPSGIFAAYLLAKYGYRPIVLERGANVDERSKRWDAFLETGVFDEEGNILFGEGGAGTFSDGKLTTLINDPRCDLILKTLHEGGADEEILYRSKPHIGTDVLRNVIKNIRHKMIEMGGEVRFHSKLTGFRMIDGVLDGVEVNHQEILKTQVCLLGIGHSARDTFEMIYNHHLKIQQKPFSIGVRIEHLQEMINTAQYGSFANHPSLGAADYKLSYHSPSGRSAYTFCMCPGGTVVCSSSEEGTVLTNGMSYHARDLKNANAALLVNVSPSEYGTNHPLAGVEFQRQFEQKAFRLGGMNYHAPVQLVGDFLNDKCSSGFGTVKPSYKPGTKFIKMTDILPPFVTNTLKEALLDFDKKIKGFASKDAILTGVETRSSSPIRIERNQQLESNISGIYPIGEGAGYAGGIMSSAVDGLKAAEQIILHFKPFKK